MPIISCQVKGCNSISFELHTTELFHYFTELNVLYEQFEEAEYYCLKQEYTSFCECWRAALFATLTNFKSQFLPNQQSKLHTILLTCKLQNNPVLVYFAHFILP